VEWRVLCRTVSLEENGHKGNALLYTYREFALVGDWILSVPSNRGKIVRIAHIALCDVDGGGAPN